MTKLTLNNLSNLQNEQTVVNTINNNNDAIEVAFDNTLSRDGTAPNTMGAAIDMNSNVIINLPAPVGASEPVRLGDMTSFGVGGTFTPLPVGGTTNQTLKKNSNANYDVGWGNGTGVTSVALALPADFNVSGSPITSTGTLTATYANAATGTGGFVRATSPTLVTPALGTPTSGVLTNATGLPPSGMAAQAAYTFVGNNTGSSAVPSAVDIATITTKGTPSGTDYVLLSDQSASGAWKKATVASVAGSTGVASIAGNTGSFTLGAGLTNSTNDIQVISGTVIGTSITSMTANTTYSSAIPVDDTIPQITEGTQVMTVSYTPKFSTSILLIVLSGQVGIGVTPDNAVVAIFNGAANAIASEIMLLAANERKPFCLQTSYSPGSTSAQIISVRTGAATQSIAFNGNPGSRFLGGSSATILTIHEIRQ